MVHDVARALLMLIGRMVSDVGRGDSDDTMNHSSTTNEAQAPLLRISTGRAQGIARMVDRAPSGAASGHGVRRRAGWVAVLTWCLLFGTAGRALAQTRAIDEVALPSPLHIEQVVQLARSRRAEIEVARARQAAAEQRIGVVSALDDPMVMPSLDHVPFMLHGADVSLMVEQRFPLSRLRGQRERSAQANARRLGADVDRVRLNVVLEAVDAYWMLYEQRAMLRVVGEQLALARVLVAAAAGRYAAGTSAQPDVLRAEIELARLQGAQLSLLARARAAKAMLNASLARDPDEPVPELAEAPVLAEPPELATLRKQAFAVRPELLAGQEEIRGAEADVEVMRSMIKPMALVRTGPAYTMADGWGFMATVGVSVPLFQQKNRATIAEAKSMADMARADLSAMRNMVQGNVASAREEVLAARTTALVLRDDVLPRARLAIDAVTAAYTSGTLPMVSALDAARALWDAQQELVMAEVELGLRWARLGRAVGRFETEQP
jgi:cobalt-zinc-cadmium efflux system outer membrane protein